MIKFKILMEQFLDDVIESEVVSSGIMPKDIDQRVNDLNKSAESNVLYRWEPDFA